MKLKKAFSILLVFAMLLSSLGFAAAFDEAVEVIVVDEKEAYYEDYMPFDYGMQAPTNSNLSQSAAEGIMKFHVSSIFDIDLDDEFQVSVEYREDWNNPGKFVWSMYAYKYNRNTSMSLDVSIDDETGDLTSIYKWDHNREEQNRVTQYTKDELQSVAYDFLKKVNGDLIGKLELQEEPIYSTYYYGSGLNPTQYRYNYVRKENGIVVSGNGINIGVDSGNGKVVSYSYNWSDIKFPNMKDIISEDEARSIFGDELTLQLSYLPVRSNFRYYDDKPSEIKLVYTPVLEGGHMIDAITGNIINHQGETVEEVRKIDVTPSQKAEFQGLEKEKRAKELDKNEVTQMVQTVVKEFFQQESKIQNTRYSSYNDRKIWNVDFTLEENEHMYGYISIDAITGDILNLYYYNYMRWDMYDMPEETAFGGISQEDAYAKAIEIMKSLYPDKLKDVKTEMTLYDYGYNQEYYFNFNRLVNGIEYPHNSISVSLNKSTGQLQSVYMNWHEAEFPKAEGLLSEDTVLAKYIDDSVLQLQFTQIYSHDWRMAPEMKLVYVNLGKDNYGFYRNIDAKTGEYLDWNGESMKEQKSKQENIDSIIKGHEAEKELKIMIDAGIIDLDNFQLDSAIPKKEILKMMVNARGFGPYMIEDAGDLNFTDIDESDEYYQYIQGAIIYGLLENKEEALNLDETVTREELAEMLMKMAQLENIAKAKDIFVVPVKDSGDINPDLMGYVALAYGLDIVKGSGENYSPNKTVTLIEVAIGIYRTFKNFGATYYYY
ncbi:YcdB/YcdC domain-containing protein [Alkaliphilus peptidifermentans]|uniref:S-layer homology domain-containing protein n=1 Tax=Alkaliphilus peptidifermentans DSM 18978 TaxID=1120976 RepID=A0A1G5KJN2_9FIRM|nr:YcdB/YcdC domain-containing protein [Alkaliphilus peptidifermentans]SCZ00159.1 S-layer homology domain-containing protein [Alkaliphilus peptidifermentans DSM 18978]